MALPVNQDPLPLSTAAFPLEDLRVSLQKVLWKPGTNGPILHRRARVGDVWRILGYIEPFQQDPQLLDTHLKLFLPDLVSAFLANLQHQEEKAENGPLESAKVINIPKAACFILNRFCKVRGQKIVVGFLNNEPRYLEPILSLFEVRYYDERLSQNLHWEERYIMLLWLSHLMLTPFDLSTISSPGPPIERRELHPDLSLPADVPDMVNRAILLSTEHLQRANKERDAAALLLVRLCIRPDMQKIGLPDAVVPWALKLLNNTAPSATEMHHDLGLLAFINGFISSAGNEANATLMPSICKSMQHLIIENSDSSLWSTAVSRKLAVKILRNMVLHSLHPDSGFADETALLEDAIDYFLRSLADNDTPVRYAASKALSMITLKLDPEMGQEVIEAVLGSLNENVLWHRASRDLSAVDPFRWHGLTLTLAHLLYRRAPSLDLMPQVLNALLLALTFEQRSPTGGSLGTNVRDAANFGIWSLSRRYSTVDLLKVDTKDIRAAEGFDTSLSVLQILALELLATACLDPGGNIRRGSSAALQELVGRHPDTINEGISLVQIVDFHAVGLRDRAMREVSLEASRLDPMYWKTLFTGLLGWRGVGSPDTPSRLSAASAIGLLSSLQEAKEYPAIFRTIHSSFDQLRPRQVEERHGLIWAMARFLTTCEESGLTDEASSRLTSALYKDGNLWSSAPMRLPVEAFTSFPLRPELTATAVCSLISAISRFTLSIAANSGQVACEIVPISELHQAMKYLQLILHRPEDSVLTEIPDTVGSFTSLLDADLRQKLVTYWLHYVGRDDSTKEVTLPNSEMTFDKLFRDSMGTNYRRGTILAIGAAFKNVESPSIRRSIVEKLNFFVAGDVASNIKMTAVRGLKLVIGTLSVLSESARADIESDLSLAIETGLNDYTITEQGDVGSLVRIEAVDAVEYLWSVDSGHSPKSPDSSLGPFVSSLLRLAVEKLDKLRQRASKCLETGIQAQIIPFNLRQIDDASSYEYFHSLLSILPQTNTSEIHTSLLTGLTTSTSQGSASVIQNSRLALADLCHNLPTYPSPTQLFALKPLADTYLAIFRTNLSTERLLLPILETFAFLLDARILQRLAATPQCEEPFKWRTLLSLVQKSHFKSSSMPKLMVAVECYRGLAGVEACGEGARTKLVGMLLHPFPKVRIAVAESLLVLTGNEELKGTDWTLPTKTLKPTVERIRSSYV